MIVRTVAPAKINWTLEVLGKRDDGYHEIRSVMQTIDLCDEVVVERGSRRERKGDAHEVSWAGLELADGPLPGLVEAFRALELLDPSTERDAKVALDRHIPVAAGLGGTSSDGAAVLRALNLVWALGLGHERLAQAAARIGSDVSFFIYGGTVLAEGRGERITRLPDASTKWLVLLAPRIRIPVHEIERDGSHKTRQMYEVLTADDFTDGRCSETLAERLRNGDAVRSEDLYNAFERSATEMFDGLDAYREALLSAGADAVHMSGSGPTLFVVAASKEDAEGMAARLRGSDARVLVARTLGAEEATRVVVGE